MQAGSTVQGLYHNLASDVKLNSWQSEFDV